MAAVLLCDDIHRAGPGFHSHQECRPAEGSVGKVGAGQKAQAWPSVTAAQASCVTLMGDLDGSAAPRLCVCYLSPDLTASTVT